MGNFPELQDDLAARGGSVDPAALSAQLACPVALISAASGDGVHKVEQFLEGSSHRPAATAKRAAIYKAQRFSDHAPLTLDYDWELCVAGCACGAPAGSAAADQGATFTSSSSPGTSVTNSR